jgi:uncharacterized repeat protein (TIGR03803 family)
MALYGTTKGSGNGPSGNCGAEGCGTIFALNASSGQERVLYSFQGHGHSDGYDPLAGVVALNGTLYGTTFFGGLGDGTVFSFKLASSQESVQPIGTYRDGISEFQDRRARGIISGECSPKKQRTTLLKHLPLPRCPCAQ